MGFLRIPMWGIGVASLLVMLVTCTNIGFAHTNAGGDIFTPLLKASVYHRAGEVPKEMLGLWERHREVVDSNFLDHFSQVDNGFWSITRVGNTIYLLNPANGVQTEVDVTRVAGKTVVFEYSKISQTGNWCHEELTLTVEDDVLQGTQKKDCYRPTSDSQTSTVSKERYFYANAMVRGERSEDELLPLW